MTKWVYYVDRENISLDVAPAGCEVVNITSNKCASSGDIVLSVNGKNALDYALVSILASRLSYDEAYVIVSKDKGYDTAIEYIASQGYLICRHDGDFYAYVPERLKEFMKVMYKATSPFTQKMVTLYEKRMVGKITNADVKAVFGPKLKSLASTVINAVSRAHNLGYAPEVFESICEGRTRAGDLALHNTLVKLMADEGVKLTGYFVES